MEKTVLIILPAYNEEASLAGVIREIKAAPLYDVSDVLIINDGSTDDTARIAWNCGVLVLTHIYNMGYGSALQTGYKYAVRHGYRYVLQLDSDGQHSVNNLQVMLERLLDPYREPVDILLGSRFLPGSQSFPISKSKMIAIKFFRRLITLATGRAITDPTSGLQALSERAIEFYARYNNFHYEYPDTNMIIQMLLNDFRIEEFPAIMHERKAGVSMHSGLRPLIYAFKMTLSTVIIILREKIAHRRKARKAVRAKVPA